MKIKKKIEIKILKLIQTKNKVVKKVYMINIGPYNKNIK